MNYEIKRFEMIGTDKLEPHPDAMAYPSEKDDRDIVSASVDDLGVLQPLIVSEEENGRHLVYDGIGRLTSASISGLDRVPCLVVEVDDARTFAMQINSAGRKRTTGSRVLCYLMAHRDKVVKVYDEASRHMTGGVDKKGGTPSRHMTGGGAKKNGGAVSEEHKEWTIKAIALRLGVSDKDVSYALELMICNERGCFPSVSVHGRYEPGTLMTEDGDLNALEKAFQGVISGRTPVRRWPAAFAGAVNLKGDGRAATNYESLALRTMTSLKTVFAGWQDIPFESRKLVVDAMDEALACAPDDIAAMLTRVYSSKKPSGKASK